MAPPSGNRNWGSKFLGRALPEPGRKRTCNWIWREAFRRFRTERTPALCDYVQPPCGWTGKTHRLSSDRIKFSSLRIRRLRSRVSPCPRSPMPEICGVGYRRFAWSTAWRWPIRQPCCFREASWIQSAGKCPDPVPTARPAPGNPRGIQRLVCRQPHRRRFTSQPCILDDFNGGLHWQYDRRHTRRQRRQHAAILIGLFGV